MAFIRANEPKPGQSAVVIANADGSGERRLITKSPPDSFAPIFWGAPSWSPDGKLIAAPLHAGRDYTAIAVAIEDGSERRLTSDRWGFVGHVGWLHDMSALILIGGRAETPDRQLWMLSYPGGQRRQITNDLFDYRMVSLTTDDKSLLTVAADATSSVWLTPIVAGASPVKLSAGKYDGLQGVAAGTDAMVITSLDSGKWDLWSVDRTGGNRRQVTAADSQGMAPAISPDGRFVVFTMPREHEWVVARTNRDGSDARVLCTLVPTGTPPACPVITPDNRWVLFHAATDGVQRIWKVSIDGGKPVAVAADAPWRPAVSPDGKWIAYLSHGTFTVIPIGGGPPARTFTNISPTNYAMVRWTSDGKGLLHNAGLNDRKNIWLQSIDGSPPRQVTHFDDQYVLAFDVVPGGKELVIARGILSRDAVLIKNFR